MSEETCDPPHTTLPIPPQPFLTRHELLLEIKEHETKQMNRVIAWVATMIGGGIFSIIAFAVTWGTLKHQVAANQSELRDLQPKIEGILLWKESMEATRVTPREISEMDKRLQRMEDQFAAVLEHLGRIESKLP